MQVYNILIVSHGDLAKGFLKCTEMFCGVQKDIVTIGFYEGEEPDLLLKKIEKIIQKWHGKDIIVLTDIRSGTPFNIVGTLMKKHDLCHISGINLAILIEIVSNRDYMSAKESCAQVMDNYHESIIDVNAMLYGKEQNE